MMNKILRYTLAALLAACAVLFLLPLAMALCFSPHMRG